MANTAGLSPVCDGNQVTDSTEVLGGDLRVWESKLTTCYIGRLRCPALPTTPTPYSVRKAQIDTVAAGSDVVWWGMAGGTYVSTKQPIAATAEHPRFGSGHF